jgi:hypothetical protein
MTEARTERAAYLFKVSESSDRSCWISTEPLRGNMPVLEHALLGFDLPTGTSVRQAEAIADFLNDNLVEINVTLLDSHPMYRLDKSRRR